MSDIFIFGASGHAKVVIDLVEKEGRHRIAFLVDDDLALAGKELFGYPVLGGKQALLGARDKCPGGIVAIGSNRVRAAVARWLSENGFSLVSAVHPDACLSRGVRIGAGTVIMAGAVVNADTAIGDNAIINTRASVDHDCRIDTGAHIAPGATLCGGVTVGELSFICAGATVAPNLTVGREAVIGAGSTVLRDIPDSAVMAGSPAKPLRS